MGYDAATVNASSAAVSAKDVGKKKKSTRTAKLKQCKLDARREQWLSQVMNKGYKVSADKMCASPPNPSSPIALLQGGNEDGSRKSKLSVRPNQGQNDGTEVFQDSDLDSPASSMISFSSGASYAAKSGGSHCSSSSTYSRSISEVEEGEEQHSCEIEDSLDDWETVADALMTTDAAQKEPENSAVPIHLSSHQSGGSSSDQDILKIPEPVCPVPMAWRPDDLFRPQSLPSLSKHRSFPLNKDRHSSMAWMNEEASSDNPLSCPVCCEDLDNTDSSFRPCDCGFILCLFCHKRILEADSRCPGCRKQYVHEVNAENIKGVIGITKTVPLRLSRACSMSARS